MGIQNGPAPEGGAIDWMTTLTMERDALQAQLQESERLRTEAFQACETMRQERDGWKAGAEAGQQQATQLRKQVEALEASVEQVQAWNKTLLQQRDELQAELDAVRETAENNYAKWQQEAVKCKAIQGQGSELQAQLETAAVTPVQQPDDNAVEQLEAVRRMIGEIRGWYACVECLGEQSAETWEQVGALLGHLQGEAD